MPSSSTVAAPPPLSMSFAPAVACAWRRPLAMPSMTRPGRTGWAEVEGAEPVHGAAGEAAGDAGLAVILARIPYGKLA
jgi:hypothetical protein